MLIISSTEFQRNMGKYQDAALTQPVAITQNGRERMVLLSAENYHAMQRQTREILPVEALTQAELAAIEAAEVPSDYRHLDRELDS